MLLGAVPFPADVKRLKDLGVGGVITLNEPYETLVSTSQYQVSFLQFLWISVFAGWNALFCKENSVSPSTLTCGVNGCFCFYY